MNALTKSMHLGQGSGNSDDLDVGSILNDPLTFEEFTSLLQDMEGALQALGFDIDFTKGLSHIADNRNTSSPETQSPETENPHDQSPDTAGDSPDASRESAQPATAGSDAAMTPASASAGHQGRFDAMHGQDQTGVEGTHVMASKGLDAGLGDSLCSSFAQNACVTGGPGYDYKAGYDPQASQPGAEGTTTHNVEQARGMTMEA